MIYTNDTGIIVNINIGELSEGNLLRNKIILVTGATSGIGREIAIACCEQGGKVIAIGRNHERLESLEMLLGKTNCKAMAFDLTNYNAYNNLFYSCQNYFGPINCLVNCAGISLHEGDFLNVTETDWDKQFDVNLKSPYFLTQAWLKYYQEHSIKSGRIVMLASDTSGMGSSIPYGLTKAGIASLTRGLAKKLAREGIRINAVAPGTTLTPMTEDFTRGEVCRDTTVGKRALFPREIAEVVVFLLSDLSTCISGNIFGCSEGNICFDNPFYESETNP